MIQTLLVVVIAGVLGCTGARPQPPAPRGGPRGVVLVIGDGMGSGMVALLLAARPHGALAEMMRDGTVGLVDPAPFGALVTDSAAGGTALATGVQTRPRMIAVDPDGRAVETLLEHAARRGLATAVVTTASLTDATPAAFLAHVVERSASRAIAAQELAAPPTIAIGGGRAWFPQPPPSIHVLADEDLPYRRSSPRPSLAALTAEALAAVANRPGGFVMMVEAALIDNAGHAHLAPELLGELLDLDDALATLAPRARAGELLVVVTADHETGGFAFQFRELAEPPPSITLGSGVRWNPVAEFGSAATIDALRRGDTPPEVAWSTEAHTSALVPLVAVGPGAPAFAGFHAQWQVGRLLRAAVDAR